MNRASKLPDFIEVANIRDLSWNNNSDLYPSCVPYGYHLVEKTRPVFVTPYVATCVLDGEFNHCIYNGEYYFLSKLEILDVEKLRYKYQLDYDVVINFMARGVDVRGTLIKTDRKDILEGCLQTTVPILADPVQKRVYGKPLDSKETWQQKLKVDLFSVDTVRKNFEEWTITKENYQAFIRRVETNILGLGTKDKQWLADTVIGGFNAHAHQNPLFILDSLPIDRTFNKWKLLLSYEIAKFFEETKKEDLIITKQTSPNDHFNIGGYVVGKKDNTIGQNIVTEVTLSRIDLSDLSDIVPMQNTSKNEMEPDKKPTYDMLPHSQKISAPTNIFALLRKPYLPIGSANSIAGCIPAPDDAVQDYCEIGLLAGNNVPQKIVTNNDRTGYLWYLNKNNLALIEEEDKNLRALGCKFSTSTWTGVYARWGFFSTEYKNIAPIGFLIYQVLKRNTEWDDLEHTGEGITSLFFRTGLRQSVLNKRYVVDADKHWWGNADRDLLNLWGDSDISKVFLDLDQFNWLSIAPSDKGYTYKYHYNNYWNYKKFFPSAGNRQIGYPSILNRMNIEFGGKEVINPYSYADPDVALTAWLSERERKLDAISIYQQVDVETGIKKGDIFTTSLEHGWYNMNELTRFLFPYDISTAEWLEWSAKDYGGTINLGVDEYAEYRAFQKRITAQGAVLVSIGILGVLLAPFTAGGSLAVTAALATPGAVALSSGSYVLSTQPSYTNQFKTSVINTLPYSNTNYQVDPELKDGTIVLYLYRGQYRIGIYKKKSTTLSLHDHDDNIIKTVDGKTHKDLDLMLIRPLEHGLLDYKQAPIVSESLKQEIIEFGLGNRDNLTPLDKTHYYSPKDIKVGTHTFDLKGTKWYLVMHNGSLNFVPKSTSVFDNIKDEGQLIDIKDDVSTYAKINQKADLNYYGQVFKLNTKFNFNGSFRYISKPLILEKEYADPDVEYKWLMVKEPNDDIDEILTLPRKETRHAEVVDSSQVLMMKERLLQISTNYEQDKYANELMLGDKRQALARQREDLNWMHTSAGVNLGLKAFGAAVGTSLFKKDAMMLGGAAALAGSMKSDVEFLLRYPTLMKRVDEDEKNLMLANSQQLYQRKQNYEHDFKFQTLKLNKIAGSYQKAGVSNRDAQEKYNKERGVSDVNIEVFLPSPVQQKQIDYIYETFGCECISDHFEYTPLSIRDNMEPGIYQFSRIENGGIESPITDTTLRELFRRILENGVKFEECKFEIEPQTDEPIHVVLPKRPKIVFDPTNIKDWSIEKWDTYKIVTDKKEIIDVLKKANHFGLSDDEWNRHKDLFKDIKDEELIDLISKIIADREEGETVVVSIPRESDPAKDKLNATIAELRGKIADLESKLDECTNNEKTLREQLAAREGNINVVQEKVNTLSLEKADLLNQIKQLKNQVQQLLNAQSTCDRINTQRIKDLEARIRELQTDLDANTNDLVEATKELEAEKDAKDKLQKALDAEKDAKDKLQKALDAEKDAKDKLQKDYDDEKKRLEDEIHNHKVDKEDLTQQLNNERIRAINEKDEINKLKKEKTDLQTKLDAKSKELEDAKKATPSKPKPASDNCPLMLDLMNDQYAFDFKVRENGWSAFIDLVFELATAIKWEGRAQIDQRLLAINEIHPLIDLLEQLKNFAPVDKAIDIVKEPGWSKYLKWMKEGGTTNGDVDKVIAKFSQLKDMETNLNVKALKGILDEMNYATYKFKTTHWTKFQNNQDIEFLLRHVYPGKALDLYKALYGDPNIAITRKRFHDEIKCVGGGTRTSIEILDAFKKQVASEMDTVVPKPPVEPKQPEAPAVAGRRPGINYPGFQTTRYRRHPITTGQRFDIPPVVWWFEDAKKANNRGTWDVDSKYVVEQSSNRLEINFYDGQIAIVFWNYSYDRRPKKSDDLWTTNRRVVYYRASKTTKQRVFDKNFSHYMEAIYYPNWDKFREVWRNRNRLIVPDNLLRGFIDGSIKIDLVTTAFDLISVQNTRATIELGTDKWEIIDEDIEDFIKLVFILDAFRIRAVDLGADNVDSYNLVSFRGGIETAYYLEHGRWQDGSVFDRLNTRMSDIKPGTLKMQLGLWFSSMTSIPKPWQLPKTTRDYSDTTPTILQYFKYIKYWGDTTCPHPFELNNGAADKMFKTLDEIKRAA